MMWVQNEKSAKTVSDLINTINEVNIQQTPLVMKPASHWKEE